MFLPLMALTLLLMNNRRRWVGSDYLTPLWINVLLVAALALFAYLGGSPVAYVRAYRLTPGEYGIKLYHDVNGDGEMNTNPFGMPIEPFAFSNNAKGRFGPARWDAARFEVTEEGASQTIAIN